MKDKSHSKVGFKIIFLFISLWLLFIGNDIKDFYMNETVYHDNFSFSKKLSKVAEQSLIITKHIPNERVIDFSKNNPGLKNKFKYNVSDDKIIINTKASKLAFIKL